MAFLTISTSGPVEQHHLLYFVLCHLRTYFLCVITCWVSGNLNRAVVVGRLTSLERSTVHFALCTFFNL